MVWFNRRKQLKSTRCGTEGVGMFISRDLLTEWLFEFIDKSIDGILLVLMTNKKTDFTCLLCWHHATYHQNKVIGGPTVICFLIILVLCYICMKIMLIFLWQAGILMDV